MGGGDDTGSIAMEFSLGLSTKKATRVWQYKANPGIKNILMGDVQRLPNGNTVVGYSASGVLHEVDSKDALVQTLTWKNLTPVRLHREAREPVRTTAPVINAPPRLDKKGSAPRLG